MPLDREPLYLSFSTFLEICFHFFGNDNDHLIEKDFVITIPKEGKEYRLCLKKSEMQEFSTYDGIVDFTQKSMRLDGIVQYKRYSLKNGKLNGLLSSPVYVGKSNISMSFP